MTTHKISETSVEKYSKPPSVSTTSAVIKLHEAIRGMFSEDKYITLLQGSYKNDTAISDINDVDIVVVVKRIISGVHGNPLKKTGNTISWGDIFTEVEAILSTKYPGKITRGDKCIKIKSGLNADIVPAVYTDDPSKDPVAIFSFREGLERLNYPRIHYENGKTKNTETNGTYKPLVRMFKNWVKNNFEDIKIAPSFYIECLIYNMPKELFIFDKATSFLYIAEQIIKTTHISTVAGDRYITGQDWPTYTQFCRKLSEKLHLLRYALTANSELEATQCWKRVFNE